MKNLVHLVVLSLLIYSTNCKKKNGKKKEDETQIIHNICDEDDRKRTVLCFCTPSEINTAKEAVCWVYGTKISGDDKIWEAFKTQPILEKLKFNIRPDGTLLNIPTKALNHLQHLQSIEIQYGHINELTAFVFSNLSSITEISIPQNQISILQPHSIAHLPKLSTLNLDGNKISEIKKDCIKDVPSLKLLYINKNNLTTVHDYAFGHLHHLEELELNTNQISVITRETFSGLKHLRYLDLRKNRLSMIGDFTFETVPNLHELVLDQNNIEYISENAFAGLKSLGKLRLSENQLKTLETDIFKGTPRLYLLDLRMNGLETIKFDTLKPLWENLKNQSSHIYLEKNRLKCDCHLSWIHALRNETHNSEMKLSLEDLMCITDELPAENSAFTSATEKSPEEQPYNVDVDSLQYDDEEVEYDEDLPSSEYENEPGRPPRKKIFDIAVESLPCPEMQMASTEMAAKSSKAYWPEASSVNFNTGNRFSFNFATFVICSFARHFFWR